MPFANVSNHITSHSFDTFNFSRQVLSIANKSVTGSIAALRLRYNIKDLNRSRFIIGYSYLYALILSSLKGATDHLNDL